ncbi:MAG TPA: LacI family DNA-binding transcriptional regulator [Candidatus Binatia bacterium]
MQVVQAMRRTPETMTLRDVARAAGVSTASASRALAGEKNVTTELRSRILAAAGRLGYVPNLAARTLATRRSGLIGMVVRNIADPLIAGVLTTCERGLAESSYGVMLTTTDGSPEQNLLATHALLARGAQGLVFVEVGASAEIARALEARGVPWVGVGEPAWAAGVSGQGVGRREGAVLAARYLLSLGHRNVAVIARPDGDTASAVRQVLDAASVRIEGLDSGEYVDLAQAAIARWLEHDDPPTAVICASDAQALAALRECAIRDIAVPRRLSLIGFGDAEFARRSYPALSTVRVATAEVGVRIAQALLASLRGDEPMVSNVAVKLIIRESTAPPLG